MALRRRARDPAPQPRWTRAAVALHQPEAEMLAGLLADHGIPVMIRRTTFDVAGGPRELLVPEDREGEARELLAPDPAGGAPAGAPESAL
jgi:hypothetical protein